MKYLDQYVSELDRLLRSAAAASGPSRLRALHHDLRMSLDGAPAAFLRANVSLPMLRDAGAFFTPSRLATSVAARLGHKLPRSVRICDPTCGAGDLLLAVARYLPVAPTLPETLRRWGTQLCGSDIDASFVSATRRRLALLAVYRLGHEVPHTPLRLLSLLPRFSTIDILQMPLDLDGVTHVVLNPPFTPMIVTSSDWAQGSVTSAAIFLERCIRLAGAGTRIVAILPEVLRSGSRYERWRRLILSRVSLNDVRIVGRFDRWVDIDVFIADLTVRRQPLAVARTWPEVTEPRCGLPRVSDLFDVHVGPVVPHRHPCKGALRLYMDAKSAPRWRTVRRFTLQRRYQGRTFSAPFVVVRRTSRPGDRHRAVATLVASGASVALENHLIVLSPRDGSLTACRRLMPILRSPRTTRWLNQRIRCRHLTVASISWLPMWRIKQ